MVDERKEWQKAEDTQAKQNNRRGLRKITWHRAAQHTLCQLTQHICIHLHPLRLVTTNSITVLWYRRLFSFSHDSSRTSWALSRRNPPPHTHTYNARLRSLPNTLKCISYSHCGFADMRHYSTHMSIRTCHPNLSLPEIWRPKFYSLVRATCLAHLLN
jgi:hypothetical protein